MFGLWIGLFAVLGGPDPVAVEHRVVVDRAGGRIVETSITAPTGLPVATRTRSYVRGDRVLLRNEGPAATAQQFAAPTHSADEIRTLVRGAGFEVRGVQAEHRPSDGSVRWRVDVAFDPRTSSRPLLWVDDRSLALRVGREQVRSVAASAYARNPVLDPEPSTFELEAIDDPAAGLIGPRFDVRQCEDPGGPGSCVLAPVAPSLTGDFVFDPPQSDADHSDGTDAFAAASIAVHAQRYAAFATAQGLPLAPCLAGGERGVLLANYRGFTGAAEIPVANAGYTGDCGLLAFFGQGPAADWGYDADVVTHELAHGTIAARMGEGRVLSGSRRRPEAVVQDAGAINESLADFVAAVVTGDAGHAEYVRAYDGGVMRDADNDLRCPGDLIGQIHYDSEPLTGALWEAHAVLGDDLVQPVIDAVALLDEDASFEDAAAAMLELTEGALGEEGRAQLQAALERHDLVDCPRVAELSQVRGPLWLTPRYGPAGYFTPMRPGPMQIRIAVPADADTMTLNYQVVVVPEPGWEPLGDVHVLVNAGEPVTFSYAVNDEEQTTVEADPDLHLASVNDGTFTIEVEPGSTVHLAFFNQGLHMTAVDDFEVSFETSAGGSSGSTGGPSPTTGPSEETSGPPPTPTSSSGGEGPSASGEAGGCRVGAGGRGLGWLLLPLGLAALRRRFAR